MSINFRHSLKFIVYQYIIVVKNFFLEQFMSFVLSTVFLEYLRNMRLRIRLLISVPQKESGRLRL